MILVKVVFRNGVEGFTRMSGDDPIIDWFEDGEEMFYPHERG